MPLIESTRIVSATNHNIDLWMDGEACSFYVEQRRQFCTFLELLDLYFSAPLCTDCALSDPFPPNDPPDISPSSWNEDVAWCLGGDFLTTIRKERKKDPDFGFRCKRCDKNLQPWAGDDVYVVSYYMEDHYRFLLAKPGQVKPSRARQRQIKNLYGNRCFACDKEGQLHIDHINPRSSGGDAAFRNLQPLCDPCGQLKGNSIPEEVGVHGTMYFGPYPFDGYEGLFW